MFVDSFQEKIWKDKYQYKGETFNEFCDRVAFGIHKSDPDMAEGLLPYLRDMSVLFGGRINSNIGVDEEGLTLFNCFIESVVESPDSLEGILDMVNKFAITLKTEGGVGFCANFLRPAKTLIRKIGVTTPGAIKFLEIFDKTSEVITSGSVDPEDSYQGIPTKKSIRKGATMVTMSINHPDIEEFITAKSVPNKLTKMNMSVLITDAFMYAVDNDLDWDLWFPDINCDEYDKEWTGDFEKWAEKGLPCAIYKTVKAKELWGLLLRSSYTRNEPGILFIDNVRKMDNLHYLENSSILTSNPCGEIPGSTGIVEYEGEKLALGDVCNLGSINLVKFYDVNSGVFNYAEFAKATEAMVRSLDNVIEVSNYPLEMYEHAAKLKRKIGVGLMGVGSLLMMKNMRYGSEDSVYFIEYILSHFMNTAYRTSALLAKEKGPFPLYDPKLLEGGYVKNSGVLEDSTLELIKEYGLRHSALTAIAPNGTLAIVAGNVSGGLEPVFAKEFFRWNRVEGKKVPFEYPNVHKGEWFETGYFKEEEIGGEVILMSTDGEYRIDRNTGLCKKVVIRDYGYAVAAEKGFENTATAMELSVDEHLNILKVFSKYIDQSSSKTINLPEDISFEEFSKLYGRIHKYGVKGCTTYRAGTSIGVLETTEDKKPKSIKEQQEDFLEAFKDQQDGHVVAEGVSLPEEYPARGYILKSGDNGKKWYVHVSFKDKARTKPFALFVSTNSREDSVSTFNAMEKLEELALASGLNKDIVEDIKSKCSSQRNPVKIARYIGMCLRHNISVIDIIRALDDVEGSVPGTFIFRIKKFLGQFAEEHEVKGMKCPECGSSKIVFSEGCFSCSQCQHSKCG